MRESKTIDTQQFATIAANLLHQGVLETQRTTAKRIFRELEEGRKVSLTRLRMEDGGEIRFDLSMDADGFNGVLNFSAFRDGLLALVANLSDALRAGSVIAVFDPIKDQESTADGYATTRIFGIPGITNHDGMVNALMLGVQPDPVQPVVALHLLYVDPNQFVADSSSSS